ncbi:MAG: D-alanyl-D-alanine carboxypeptidase family protein [Patescibacteria group bacterium]
MNESKNVLKSEIRRPKTERIIALFESDEKDGIIAEASSHIKAKMDEGVYMSLANRNDMKRLQRENSAVDTVFNRILALTGLRDFGDVHPPKDFEIIDAPYRGADGKTRRPLPKYVPKHILPSLTKMQNAYDADLEKYWDVGAYKRPGLILQSAYRSPYYQIGIFARTILERGIRKTLQSVALPGTSQHANYEHCAFDINNIGDSYGKTKRADGRDIGFEETMEFDWLLKHAPSFGFWLPFFPNRTYLQSTTGGDGVLVEPWHIQYTPNAGKRMSENRVPDLFKMWTHLKKAENSLKPELP